MQKPRKLFGTDGIRSEANVYPMTVEIALALGRAMAYLLHQGRLGRPYETRKRVVIGKDTRLSCYAFEQAMAAGLCSMGIDVWFVGPLPTPGVAFITRSMRADAGIVISASHNPFHDNGIKIFGHDGFKLPDSVEHQLEELILTDFLKEVRPTGEDIGRAKRIDDVLGRYVEHLKDVLPGTRTLEGMRIVVDCAHGAAYKVAPLVLEELDAEVIAIGNKPNGLNINKDAGALHPHALQEKMHEVGAHLGIALDGDADRAVFVNERGAVVNGDAILALLAVQLKQEGALSADTLVTTQMSNHGLEKCLSPHGIRVERAQVGDRYVVERMLNGGFNLGGEDSGHLILLDHSTTGDGMVAALSIANLMLETQKPLSELETLFKPTHRSLRNIFVPKKIPIQDLQHVSVLINRIENELAGEGRVFVRYSGTESKARILVEGPSADQNEKMTREIEDVLLRELA